MTVKIEFGGSDKKVAAWLSGKGPVFIYALATRLNILMLQLQSHIVRDKLSGQVLHRRTGKLAGSIIAYPAEASGTMLIARVEGAGGPAWYGRVHEFGGDHDYDIFPVNKKALAFFPQGYGQVTGGRQILRGMNQRTNLSRHMKAIVQFGEAGGVVVRSVHHPALPARPFMRPSAVEMRPQIVRDLQSAINEKGKG